MLVVEASKWCANSGVAYVEAEAVKCGMELTLQHNLLDLYVESDSETVAKVIVCLGSSLIALISL